MMSLGHALLLVAALLVCADKGQYFSVRQIGDCNRMKWLIYPHICAKITGVRGVSYVSSEMRQRPYS